MIWEFVQGVGSTVGLATGIFVPIERITRHDPAIYFVAEAFGGDQRYAHIRIHNPGPRPILVRIDEGVRPGAFYLAG